YVGGVVVLQAADAPTAQSGKLPPRKSFSTEVADCEERVSNRKLLIQGTCSPTRLKMNVRSTPPVKKAPAGMTLVPAFWLLFAMYCHSAVWGAALVMAHVGLLPHTLWAAAL